MNPSLIEMLELKAWFLLLFVCEHVMVLTKLDQHVTRSDVMSLIEAEQSNNVSLMIR